jgi:NTE family protein
VLGILYNAVFLDLIDEDILRLQKVNHLLKGLSPEQRNSMRIVEILVLRPSQDLGKLASDFEEKLPRVFRYLTRGLGTQQTASPDIVSLILFQADYLRKLVELGEADAEAHAGNIAAFLARAVVPVP